MLLNLLTSALVQVPGVLSCVLLVMSELVVTFMQMLFVRQNVFLNEMLMCSSFANVKD
jgi:hypothetical protein